MDKIYLVIYNKKLKRTFTKYFETEWEKDKYKRKIRFICDWILIEDSTDINWNYSWGVNMGDILEKYCKKLEKEKEELFEDNRKVKAELWLYKDNDEYMNKEIERLNNIINRIESIYSSLCFSAPENNYIFIEELGEVLQELKGSDKEWI